MPSQHASLEAGPQTPCSLPLFAYALSREKKNGVSFLAHLCTSDALTLMNVIKFTPIGEYCPAVSVSD